MSQESTDIRAGGGEAVDEDAAQLAALGYTSEFKREMGLWANLSLGFTYLSPVVGVYTLFASSLATAGPPMIWALVIVGIGQFLVALVFGEVVAQYPVSGGIYPWARRLWGKRWAWMTGWVYMFALLSTIASVAYGAAPYVAQVLGIESTTNASILCALALIVISTAINFLGTKVVAYAAFVGFAAELLGALAVGGWLLLTEHHYDLGVVFDTFGAGSSGSYLTAFTSAALIGIFLYFGFEACGDVAEEVANPGIAIPKAMRLTVYIGGAAATFVALALLLAVPDMGAVVSGKDADPVATALTDAFGTTGVRVVLCVVLISFLSCVMSLQAAASRLTYSYARDKMVAGHRLFAKFSERRHVPPYALLLAAAVPALVIFVSKFSTDALTKIVSFASVGIYIGFQMVVLAALRARLRGWNPGGKFSLGRWGTVVNAGAVAWGICAIVVLIWPRTPDLAWYDNYLVLLAAAVVIGLGLVYMWVAKPYEHSDARAGDAIPAPSNA